MDREKILEILKYYIAEDIQYLYYENRMYPNWVTRDELINRIADDIINPRKEIKSSCGMEGDNSGLDKEGCSCGTSCNRP